MHRFDISQQYADNIWLGGKVYTPRMNVDKHLYKKLVKNCEK